MSTIAEQIAYFRGLTTDYIAYYRDLVATQIKNGYDWAISLYTSGWLKAQALWLLQKFMQGFKYGYNFVLHCLDAFIAIRDQLIHLIKNLPRFLMDFTKALYHVFIDVLKLSKELLIILKDITVALFKNLGTFINQHVLPFLSKVAEKIFARLATTIGVVFGISTAIVDLSFDLFDFLYKNTLGHFLPALSSIPFAVAALPYIKGALAVGLVAGAGYGIYIGCKKLYPHAKKIYDKGLHQQAKELLNAADSTAKNLRAKAQLKENRFITSFGVGILASFYFLSFGLSYGREPTAEIIAISWVIGAVCGVGSFIASFFMKDQNERQANQETSEQQPRRSTRLNVQDKDHAPAPAITPLREQRARKEKQEAHKEEQAPRRSRRHKVA